MIEKIMSCKFTNMKSMTKDDKNQAKGCAAFTKVW